MPEQPERRVTPLPEPNDDRAPDRPEKRATPVTGTAPGVRPDGGLTRRPGQRA